MWSRPAFWVILLFTVGLWIASIAYTQNHTQRRPTPVEKPGDQPPTAEDSYNNGELSKAPAPVEKPHEIEKATQIEQPNPKSHPKHFEAPIEPEFIPEEPPWEDRFHIV